MNSKTLLLTGAILGFLSVALGAFGAHALKATLTANGRIDTFETAVRYSSFTPWHFSLQDYTFMKTGQADMPGWRELFFFREVSMCFRSPTLLLYPS